MATGLQTKTRTTELRGTDILHLQRDPDLVGRQDCGITAAALGHHIAGARSIRDMIYLDGITAGARCYWSLGTAGDVSALDWTLPLLWIDPPSASPAGSVSVLAFGANSDPLTTGDAGILAYLTNTGRLNIEITSQWGTNTRRKEYDNFVTTYLKGLPTLLHFRRNFTGNDFSLVVNGTPVAASREGADGGTPPAWNYAHPSAFFSIGARGGATRVGGRFIPFSPINGLLSDDECLIHAKTGLLPVWCGIVTGSAVPLNTQTFGVGGTPYDTFSGASTTGFSAIKTGSAGTSIVYSQPNITPVNGQKLLARFTATLRSGTAPRVRVANAATGLVAGANTIVFTSLTSAPTTVQFYNDAGESTDYSISNFSVITIASCFEPGFQDGTYQSARDMKASGIDGIHTAGVIVAVDGKRRPQVRAKNVNVGTAAYLIQSADVLLVGWDVDCVQITNNGAGSAVDVKVQLSDGTNHTDLMTAVTIPAGGTKLAYPADGGLDTRRRLRAVATSGADNLTFNFSLRKRA